MSNSLLRRFIVRTQVPPLTPFNMQDTYIGSWFNSYQECWDEFYSIARGRIGMGSPYFEFESGTREIAYPILSEMNVLI